MCDYSLQNVKSRPAKVGDKLTTHNFYTGTGGFALLPLNPEERHQGEDAALSVVVHPHGDRDIFDAGYQDKGPKHE